MCAGFSNVPFQTVETVGSITPIVLIIAKYKPIIKMVTCTSSVYSSDAEWKLYLLFSHLHLSGAGAPPCDLLSLWK